MRYRLLGNSGLRVIVVGGYHGLDFRYRITGIKGETANRQQVILTGTRRYFLKAYRTDPTTEADTDRFFNSLRILATKR